MKSTKSDSLPCRLAGFFLTIGLKSAKIATKAYQGEQMSIYSLIYGLIIISMVGPLFAQVYYYVVTKQPETHEGFGPSDWKLYLGLTFWVIICDALVFSLVEASHLSAPHLIFFFFGGWAPFWLLGTTKKLYHLYHQGPTSTIPTLV